MSLFSFWLRILLLLFAQIELFTVTNAQQMNYTCPYNFGPCSISCNSTTTNSNCPLVIDGTISSYLNINCYGNVCKNRIIKCPNSGCSLYCNGDYSCQGTKIEYDGSISDNGNILVNCIGSSYTCYYMTINEKYIDKISISCTSNSISNY